MLEEVDRRKRREQAEISELARQNTMREGINRIAKKTAALILSRVGGTFSEVIREINRKIAEAGGSYRTEATSEQLEKAADYITQLYNDLVMGKASI